MRFAILLLVALTTATLIGCEGGEDEAAASVPVAQRFVTAEDAPGSKPDPVEQRKTTVGLDEFIADFHHGTIDADREEMTAIFQEAGVKGAGMDTRFFGETHKPKAVHLASWFIELGSEEGAMSALDWLEADLMKPCPTSCAAQISTFDVDAAADARGVRRTSTAEDIASFGSPDERPSDSYWIGFTDGASVYTVELWGPPGSVSEEQAQEIASAYRDRLTSN